MNIKKIRGVVIKEVNIKEKDKIIVVFGKDIGKVSINAKGARALKSKFLAGTNMFSYCDFIVTENKKIYYLKEIDIIKSFHNIVKKYENIFIGSYMVENCNKGLLEREEENDVLILLINSLNRLSSSKVNHNVVLSVFELKFLKYNGYEPIMNQCTICGVKIGLNYIGKDGVICTSCKKSYHKKINDVVKYTIRYILNSDIKEVFNFVISKNDMKSLNETTNTLLLSQIDYKLNSLEFII